MRQGCDRGRRKGHPEHGHAGVGRAILPAEGSANVFQRILVPLDGSPLAEAPLQPAVELAQALGPGQQPILHLLQVVDAPFLLADPGGLKTGEQIDPHARASTRRRKPIWRT